MVRVSGPVLRPHSVLAEVEMLAPTQEVEERFFAVVQQPCREFDQLVRSKDPKPALATMAVNEVVARRAVNRALDAGRVDVAWFVADSLRVYLRLTGRAGEGARLMRELYERAGGDEDGELTQVQAALAIQAAWARAARDAAGAVAPLERLLSRLETVEEWDPRHKRASALMTLGRVHYNFLGHPASALEPLKEAERLFGELEEVGSASTVNRAAVLGDRANALRHLSRYDEALAATEEALALSRDRGDTSAIARGLGQTAHILRVAGRLGEAEERYGEALKAAREAGDDELLGILYQQLGSLADDRSQYDEAEGHYRRALEAFEQAGDQPNRMRTLNLLGAVEGKRSNLREAQTWFERSRSLAEELKNLAGQADARSNLARLHSTRAEQTEEPEARRWLHQAIAEEREALEIDKTLGQPASIAISHSNLADYLRRDGQLDEAEEHAREALAIREKIGDPRLWQTLGILELIAQARGDETAAAEWRRRKQEAYAEAQERAGPAGLGLQGVTLLLQLAHAARTDGVPLGEALAQADAPDDLLDQIRERDPWLLTHLQALAGGEGRPEAQVPALYSEVVDAAWRAVG